MQFIYLVIYLFIYALSIYLFSDCLALQNSPHGLYTAERVCQSLSDVY